MSIVVQNNPKKPLLQVELLHNQKTALTYCNKSKEDFKNNIPTKLENLKSSSNLNQESIFNRLKV